MTSPVPKRPFLRSGTYEAERNTFADFGDIARSFAPKKILYSVSSPPLLKDVKEGEMVLDKTALRIYITVDGTLRYFVLT